MEYFFVSGNPECGWLVILNFFLNKYEKKNILNCKKVFKKQPYVFEYFKKSLAYLVKF